MSKNKIIIATLFLIMLSTTAHADDAVTLREHQQILTPTETDDINLKKSQIHDYLLSKGSKLLKWLPSSPVTLEDVSFLGIVAYPFVVATKVPDKTETEAVWLSPGYQHNRGILPFQDAVTLGPVLRNNILDKRVKFDVHPYYAQNWTSTDNYWGVKTTLGIGPSAEKAWGDIVVDFSNGNENLMNHTRGVGLKSDLNFDKNWSLGAGVTQDNDARVMLRWKMITLDNK